MQRTPFAEGILPCGLWLLQQEYVVPFGIVESSPRRPRTFGAGFDVDETFATNRLDSILNAWNLHKNYRLVLRRVVFHAFFLQTEKSLPDVELRVVAGLLAKDG
jgi:hypothetical protein